MSTGSNAWLSKTDITNAFKLLPMHPSLWHLHGVKWRNRYYFSTRLTFGSRSSPKLFDIFAETLCWLLLNIIRCHTVIHYLDDFLIIEPSTRTPTDILSTSALFTTLGVPLSPAKTIGPTTKLNFLGIELDSATFRASLPTEKLVRLRGEIDMFLRSDVCTRKELQSLLGSLNFAMRIVPQGRSFVSRLLCLLHGVPDDCLIALDQHAKADLLMPLPLYYKYVLTFRFAIEEINRNVNILPNITLGFHMYDSCSDGPKAVKSILQILSGPGKSVPNYHCRGRGQIAGFIGDHSSVTTLPMAQILGVYRYTQISYGATHDVLNDRYLYPTFFRTLQSDNTSYSVLSKLLKHFGWTWVGILASDDDSGEKETLVLTKHMTSNGICVAFKIKIKVILLRDTDRVLESYRNIVKESTANIIVICGTFSPYVANFFRETGDIFADRTLILNPTFAVNNFLLEFYPKTFNGSLALEHFPIQMPDMMTFFKSFHPLDHPDDCFLKHLWLLHFRCDVGDQSWHVLKDIYKISLHNCTGKERLTDFTNFAPDGLSPRVYHAVHAMTEGLQQINLFLNRKKHIHKDPVLPPGRPIVAGVDSLLSPLSQYIDTLLQPLVLKTKAHLKDSINLLQTLDNFVWVDGYILVTSDVGSLYTVIEHHVGCEAVEHFLRAANSFKDQQIRFIVDGIRIILQNNFFWFENEFYIQRREISRQEVHFLDLKIFIENGTVKTKTFFKTVDVNSFIDIDSCHFKTWLSNIPKGQFMRLKRNCTDDNTFIEQSDILKKQFYQKGYEREQLHHYLRRLTYSYGSIKKEFFNENGEYVTMYNIINWKILNNNKMVYDLVGYVNPHALDDQQFFINPTTLTWKSKRNEMPRSQCSENCLPGSRKIPKPGIHSCCYDCVKCSEGEISNITDSENCRKCPNHEWPNEEKVQCVPKQVEFLSYSNDVLSLVFSSVSSIFLLLTALILGIFIFYQNTPIVKANNKTLSFILLFSIMLSFFCVFLFIGRPLDITCMLRQTSFGVIFSVGVSSVLAKTIMVCAAFRATKPDSVWKTGIGVKLSNIIVLFCSSVQVVISIIWLAICPPFQELDTQSYKGRIIIQCNEGSVIAFYLELGYMGILAAISFVMAFMVRTLPDMFNEAKYITFSMLVFCSVWIAMIPAYLSTKGKDMVAVEIFAILASSAGILGCIFLPKCYIILCRSEINTKSYLFENKKVTI
ncbi:vomeronasal type-2 receptor 26-like [Pelobates fuscus]|uniref:vomeronasal type-2 receptor 26-like n=1 Tax=Pelobates fuscus TaxID=191477 RepID=UPI002FE49F4A